MECGDPHIHASMDGQEFHAGAKPPRFGKREEPTVFFFVIFGLVYEALATSSPESTSAASARQALVISALQTLKSLVRPEYSGKAIMEPMIFEEFISLCYRIAMTESARIQVHLLEMLSVFAASQDQELA
jgi:HEAT repeat-containing protein 5